MLKAKASYPDRWVIATDATAPRYATCGCCGGSVVLRSGSYRRRHYAHRPGEGSADCEEYFGSDGTDYSPVQIVRPPVQVGRRQITFYQGGGLYIGQSKDARPELSLRFPTPEETDRWDGKIFVTTPEGERPISYGGLKKPQNIRLRMDGNPVRYRTEGNVSEKYLARLDSEAFRLIASGTVFRWSAVAGRLLERGPSLCWGDKCWLLTQRTPKKEFIQKHGSAVRSTHLSGPIWWLFEVQLPTVNVAGKELVRRHFQEFLGRGISDPQPQVTLWSPLPHHIDQDRVFKIPAECDTVVVKRSEDLWIDAITQDGVPLNVFEDESEFVSIMGVASGLTTIYFDGRVAFEIVREDCPFFKPASIGFIVQGRVLDIFESQSAIDEFRLNPKSEPIPFVLSNEALAPLITLNGIAISAACDIDDALKDRSRVFKLEARAFGRIELTPLQQVSNTLGDTWEFEVLGSYVLGLSSPKGTEKFCLPESIKQAERSALVKRLMLAKWMPAHRPHLNRLSELLPRNGSH